MWTARRAAHLANEIARANAEVLAARQTVADIAAKGAETGVTYTSKLDAAAAYQGEVEEYWKALRAQAEAEFPDVEAFAALVERAPASETVTTQAETALVQAMAGEAPVSEPVKKHRWWRGD
jgi:hypothetical protein